MKTPQRDSRRQSRRAEALKQLQAEPQLASELRHLLISGSGRTDVPTSSELVNALLTLYPSGYKGSSD